MDIRDKVLAWLEEAVEIRRHMVLSDARYLYVGGRVDAFRMVLDYLSPGPPVENLETLEPGS